MDSENPTGGDNQQETAPDSNRLNPYWVSGFVDGEGCFSVSIHRNPYTQRTRGWQLHAVFQVTQHQASRHVLEELRDHFGCGKVRTKGPGSTVMVYAVDSMTDLEEHILPFFERYPLKVKHADFRRFATIVRSLCRKEHFTETGFERIVRLAYAMNQHGKQRARTLEEVLAGSSETVRQARSEPGPLKIQSDPHGDMRSQAEMT
jgi:hypothetical protein